MLRNRQTTEPLHEVENRAPLSAESWSSSPHTRSRDWPRPVRTLLRLPLFYKILVANAVIVVIGTVFGATLTQAYLRVEPGYSAVGLIGLLALSGAVVTVLVNAVIVRLALSPLKLLERTAAHVQGGDLDARVPASMLADREMERLSETLNGMLDTLDTYRQRMREVAARAIQAEEEERKRIARELHDDTAQALAVLLIRLRLARGITDPAARDALLEELRVQVSEALERVRRFARGLRPAALEELGLQAALEAHIRTLSESVGLSLKLEAEPYSGDLSPQSEVALYRIVQEALSNAVRHSGADRVVVRLAPEGSVLAASIEDNGRGFDVDAVLNTNEQGLGLFGMRERAAYIGGRVEIRSQLGAGTAVRVLVPLNREVL
jgi:two-component system, NarL family, sensor histidine kinase UhpB